MNQDFGNLWVIIKHMSCHHKCWLSYQKHNPRFENALGFRREGPDTSYKKTTTSNQIYVKMGQRNIDPFVDLILLDKSLSRNEDTCHQQREEHMNRHVGEFHKHSVCGKKTWDQKHRWCRCKHQQTQHWNNDMLLEASSADDAFLHGRIVRKGEYGRP